jgi:hypothetical protein
LSSLGTAAVQRILRHRDPRITTEVYGHLAPDYLRGEIDRLHFDLAAVAPPPPSRTRVEREAEALALVTPLLQARRRAKKRRTTARATSRKFRWNSWRATEDSNL